MTIKQLLDLNDLLCEVIEKRQDDYNEHKDDDDSYSDLLKIGVEYAELKYDDFMKMEVNIK